MTGPVDSVIGMKKETAISRSLTQMPLKMEVSNSTAEIQGVIVDIDLSTGAAVQDREDTAAFHGVECLLAKVPLIDLLKSLYPGADEKELRARGPARARGRGRREGDEDRARGR